MQLPRLFKETNIFKKNAIANGMTDAGSKAVYYIANNLSEGTFIHNRDDTDPFNTVVGNSNANGVLITGTAVKIIIAGVAVSEYGISARVGKAGGAHIVLNPDNTVFYDESGSPSARIIHGETVTESVSYTSEEIFDQLTGSPALLWKNLSAPGLDVTAHSISLTVYYKLSSSVTSYTSKSFTISQVDTDYTNGNIKVRYDGEYFYINWTANTMSNIYLYYTYSCQRDVSVPCFLFGITNSKLGKYSFCAGKSVNAPGDYSHATGEGTVANSRGQTVIGMYNIEDTGNVEVTPVPGRRKYALIIGNGSSENDRSNACAVTWDGDVETAKGNLVPQKATTTWTKPTVTSNRISFPATKAGGYYVEGKHCYVQMRFTIASKLNANNALAVASDMPVPADSTTDAPLTILVNNRGGHAARVQDDGTLQLIADYDHDMAASALISICGVYTIA